MKSGNPQYKGSIEIIVMALLAVLVVVLAVPVISASNSSPAVSSHAALPKN